MTPMKPVSEINPLGQPSPERYQPGSWPHTLLQRMVYWLQRCHCDGRVLDLGCGEGALLAAAGLQGTGADLNAERLKFATSKGLQVVQADGAQLPFADACFDVAISMEVLEHVPDMQAIMREVHRVLRPDGHWLISVPNVTLKSWYEMWKDKRPYYCSAEEHYREFIGRPIPWFEHKFMLLSDLDAVLKQHGFRIWHREGLYFQLPDSWLPGSILKKAMETALAHRICSRLPFIRHYPYWTILVLRKSIGWQ